MTMTAAPVLCVGLTPTVQRTLEFDAFRVDHVNRARRTTVSAAGKGVNVALVLHALGAPSLTLGFLGGPGGAVVDEYLAARGVGRAWIRARRPTRTCTTVLDEASGRVTELVEEAPLPEPDEWAALHAQLAGRLPGAPWLALSGALMPGSPPDTFERILAAAAAAGVPAVVDSQKEPLRRALRHRPFLVKMNAHELGATTGAPVEEDAEVDRAARGLLAEGAGWILITRGPRSARLLGAESAWEIHPPKLKPVNPIGSGDCVTAGLLKGLLDGASVPDAAALGMACGAANALTLTPSDVDAASVARLLPAVTMRRLA